MPDGVANKEYFDSIYQAAIDALAAIVTAANVAIGQVASEVAEARGDRSTLHKRISCISNFASPNAGGIVVGNYYDNCFQGSASGSLAGATGRFTLAPFYTSDHLPIDQIGVLVATAVAGALGKIVIYSSGADNWPDALEWESGDLDFGTTGFKSAPLSYTFDAGRQYWVGVRESSTATLRTVAVASAVNLGVGGSTGTSYYTVLRRTLAYATATPALWNFVKTDLAANVTPPSIRFRAA